MSSKRPASPGFTAPDNKKAVTSAADSESTASGSLRSQISSPTSSQASVAPPPQAKEPVPSRSAGIPSGIVTALSQCFAGPSPCHDDVYIVVNSIDMTAYFESLHETLVYLLYPDFDPAAAVGVITTANFVIVCRYLVKARCDNVFGKVSGRRPARRIPIPNSFQVPLALAILINGIGTVTVNSGALPCCPQPEAVNAADANQNLDVLVTHNMLALFERLVKACALRNFIRTGFISSIETGTAWWLLTARNSADPAIIAAQDANHCSIYAVFREWTPSDALFASIALRQNDGLFGGLTELMWTTDPTRAIGALRQEFNSSA